MPDKGGLQLLPETRKKIDIKIPGENRMLYIGSGALVLILALYSALGAYQSSLEGDIAAADGQLMTLEQQRNKKTEHQLTTLAKQVDLTSTIVKDHVYWSTALSRIEAAVQPSVQFKSFSAGLGDDTFRIRALADNYVTIAKQMAAFSADEAIKDITLDGVSSLTSGKLDFSVRVSFDRSKFLVETP